MQKLIIATACVISLTANAYATQSNQQPIGLAEVKVVAKKPSNAAKKNQTQLRKLKTLPPGQALPNIATQKPTDNGRSTAKIMNNMPGVQILGGARTVAKSLTIGGLANQRVFVGIDGVNDNLSFFGHNQTRVFLSQYLYKTATVSGSGSNLTYGSGNLGGAINFVTLDPADLLHNKNFAGRVGLGAGSADTSLNANAAVALKKDKVSFLVSALGGHANDVRLGGGAKLDNSANNNLQYLAKTVWDISSAQSLKLSILSMQNNGLYPEDTNKEQAATNPTSNYRYLQRQTMLDYHLDPDNKYTDFNFKTYYNENHFRSMPTNDGDGFALPQDMHVNTTGLMLSNRTKIARQDLLYGAEYSFVNGYDNCKTNTMVNYPAAKQNSYALYLHDNWRLVQRLTVGAGARLNSYNSKGGELTNNHTFVTKQASINYNIFENLNIFAGYTEGFRIPSLQDLYLAGTHPSNGPAFLRFLANPNLKPEIGHNKTIGFSSVSYFKHKQSLSFSSHLFFNDVDNYIIRAFVSVGGDGLAQDKNINISKAQLHGYVVSGDYHNQYFDLASNFTYTTGKTNTAYTDYKGNPIPAGNYLPIPRAKGLVQLGVPVYAVDSSIQTQVEYALDQKRLPFTVAFARVPGYVILNLIYQWQPRFAKNLTVNLGVDNILDKDYQNYDGAY